ncbi:hypothetical protein Dalk_3951 [Desulfatibacillum aliphaticivorans]|uniref:Uncharacterized protein n=1 Tax=Desulfatibacillum aliphaticivorans TaxID=218208 RepID=B8FJG8_DESAL|nr:hypothetical protein [Desulfatibacillum aliphaticivorans]ACL05637.1 hypothetical protein Dalk_3951 [Desulfatibacillum aliphaticivorans]
MANGDSSEAKQIAVDKKEAKKVAAVQKRWQELMAREEEKNKRRKESRGLRLLRRIIKFLNEFFQRIADFIMTPFHAIHDSMVQAKKARLARKKARMERRRPILEAKALARVEKKRRKEAAKEARRLAKEARRGLPLGQRFVKIFNEKTDAFVEWLAAPGRILQERRKMQHIKAMAKQKAKLDKTALSREKIAQRKHARLVWKAQRAAEKKARSRERWRWVREKRAQFKEFWDYTVVLRRFMYLIGITVFAYYKRDYLIAKIQSIVGYDLQNLLH